MAQGSSLALASMLGKQYMTIQTAKTVVFWYLVLCRFVRVVRHLRARGLITAAREAYLVLVRKGFACMLLLPSVRNKVQGELDQVTLDLAGKLAPKYPDAPTFTALPETGLASNDVTAALAKLSDLPRTEWEGGRVSGAVYHGGKDMGDIWREAFGRFEVSNPLHADVFPGVRKMDAEVVSMCLSLYNAPLPASAIDDGGAGTTTSGGTESILMACKAYRDRARAEFGITEPEMIVPKSVHAAFDKAAMYFGIKIHHIPVDRKTRKVQIAKVRRAINVNTILLVGSAPNFPDGAIDDISALSDLAVKHRIGLHVDCCLGSFLVPFLERAGFPTVPFDFRVPGVTSISCDTHKYGFSPKGSSCIMYRSKQIRKYQYSVTTTWPGGVYATPSMSGSRPGALIAGAWASLVHMGIDGYTQSCRDIVGAAKRIAHGVKKDFPELYVLGDPLVSVVAFGSKTEGQGNGKGCLPIYEVGDRMSKAGWHLNALQDPPALHIACTRLTVTAVDDFLRDLRVAVDEVKALEEPGKGSMVMLYGLGTGSAVGGQLIGEMASRYMDVVCIDLYPPCITVQHT
ncbi:pyridoxal phosphate-dependent transferase [Rhodotorula diobovata]|uniref:sphinganine-1-phosphate aldolase n=1 Tax=Rhodotorula diobovata TaxID=5288 RepID=A0A5C5FZD8_9BASI|nr:pyridoxal phosphate-dependent transferase [Rhodotorula diobovata]